MSSSPTSAQRSITINRSAEAVYRSWRDPQVLTAVMGSVAEVTPTDGDQAHWVAQDPNGQRLEWDTQIVADQPGEHVRWTSLPGAVVPAEGDVSFRAAPGDRGTEVTLRLQFDPTDGAHRVTVANVLGETPNLVAEIVLRRFKSLVETGEIPTTIGQPAARNGGRDT